MFQARFQSFWLFFGLAVFGSLLEASDKSVSPADFGTRSGLFPLASQTDLWEPLIGPKRELWKERAAAILEADYPVWTEDVYLEYVREGVRTNYDDLRRVRERRFYRLLLGVLATGAEGPWLEEFEATLLNLANEPLWVMPSHDPELKALHGEYMQIDLGSAMRAFDLAFAVELLRDKLPPETIQLVEQRVRERVLNHYYEIAVSGKQHEADWWIEAENNWNAVCHFGVIGAALILERNEARRETFIEGMLRYIPNYLKGFTSDGYCNEGLSYYNFGFLQFNMLAELVRRSTDGRIDLLKDPKIEAIALFPHRLRLDEGTYPIFADGSLTTQPAPVLTAFLSLRFEFLRPFVDHPGTVIADAGIRELLSFGFVDQASVIEVEDENLVDPLRSVFPDGGLVVSRGGDEAVRTAVALKAGHNGESHNHNDVGSVVISVDATPIVIDPGKEVYSRRTFGPNRYDSDALNSYGHSVPVVAGQLQSAGPRHYGRIVETEFSAESDRMVVDLTRAYAVETLESLNREITHHRGDGGRIEWVDRVVFSKPETFVEALITLGSFEVLGESVGVIKYQGKQLKVEWESSEGSLKVDQTPVVAAYPEGVDPLRISFALEFPVEAAEIRFVFTPMTLATSDVVREVATSEKVVALTFDDGPEELGLRIAEVLAQFEAKATFFVVGDRLENARNAEILKELKVAGHEIGNHSYDHPHLTTMERESIVSQLQRTQESIRAITGEPSVVFRAPYLEFNDDVTAIASEMGMWSISANRSTLDWSEETSPSDVIERAVEEVTPGSIVLMHSWSEKSFSVLPQILGRLQAEGYKMVTVSELLRAAN
jgi:peptidoglycan/xylan/chitin deacetylase (PgdA/CDA1 family)